MIELSGIRLTDWFALKKYDDNKRSYLQMYVELADDAQQSALTCSTVLREHLSIYFKYYDSDYEDLKGMLGIEPLSVTVLPAGTLNRFEQAFGRPIRRINPPRQDEIEILRML